MLGDAMLAKEMSARLLQEGICRPQRRAHQGAQDRHLRHRHAHLQLGRLGQKTIPVPMAVGHEYVRRDRRQVGAEVRGFTTGDRVSGEGHITCGHCRNCRAGAPPLPQHAGRGREPPGSFAEYLVHPGHNVFKLPDAIDDEIASILDPFGNATHTALAFNVVGEDVLITGAGPIGIMAVAIARIAARGTSSSPT
jgi:threonine dehydrogenase-like Zn-dependent dehydrogenase